MHCVGSSASEIDEQVHGTGWRFLRCCADLYQLSALYDDTIPHAPRCDIDSNTHQKETCIIHSSSAGKFNALCGGAVK